MPWKVCHVFAMLATLLCVAATSFSSESFRPLPTELKVSSLGVSIRAPLGFRYRPGETFPLELHVTNPGSAMNVEILAVESGSGNATSSWAERAVLPGEISLPAGTSRYLLPMRSPGVSAAIDLIIRGGSSGGGKAELFRANLSRELHPLPSAGRVVVFCGGGGTTVWSQDQSVRLNPDELPQEDWVWESIDWLVLNDASLKSAPPEALNALRYWQLGGGRVLLRSPEALSAALSLRLLPIEPINDIPADVNWWQKNAALTSDDVLVSKNFRPLYARLRHGFGQIVFLFPGSQPSTIDEAAVFNRADVQRHRAQLPDARVQPERFAAFASSEASDPQRRRVMLWSLFGAAILCIALLFARTSRSKIETVLVPIGAIALLSALLANGFQQHELTVARVTSERVSADGAAVVSDEWTLLEAFRGPIEIAASGPQNGMLAPRFDEIDDLRVARLERVTRDRLPILERIAVAPHKPAMLFSHRVELRDATKNSAQETMLSINSVETLRVKSNALCGVDLNRALWARADGRVLLLQKNASNDVYRAEAFDARALELALSEQMDSGLAKARSVAISWAVKTATEEGGGALIVWGDASKSAESLVAIHVAALSASGNDFVMRTIGLTSK